MVDHYTAELSIHCSYGGPCCCSYSANALSACTLQTKNPSSKVLTQKCISTHNSLYTEKVPFQLLFMVHSY